MRFLLSVLLWFILFALCWPLAILAIFLFPIIWLISIPFRLVGVTVTALLQLVKAILLLPFKVAGVKI
jgi:hypothetical protein